MEIKIMTTYNHREFNGFDATSYLTYTHTRDTVQIEDQLRQAVTIQYCTDTDPDTDAILDDGTDDGPIYYTDVTIGSGKGKYTTIYSSDMPYENFKGLDLYPENPTQEQLLRIAATIYIRYVKNGEFTNIFHYYKTKQPTQLHFCRPIPADIAALFDEIN